MNIAFVGIEKDWDKLEKENYVFEFIKYHLELPWYYSVYGNNDVDIVSNTDSIYTFEENSNCVQVINKNEYSHRNKYKKYDVVVHWRKWIDDCYSFNAINVINSQDHSYSKEWLRNVEQASSHEKLHGILCFPTWHVRNLAHEMRDLSSKPRLLPGVTLGVDTGVYIPDRVKNPYDLLWASDPGRGLQSALEISGKLHMIDKRFKLHVCWPDYVDHCGINYPWVELHKNLKNGEELWRLFNKSGFLLYTSSFKEPSSRVHRQAMSAGCVVLYPPDRGTPSELLTNQLDGVVCHPSNWIQIIYNLSQNENKYKSISENARYHALRENWKVQALRFNNLFWEIRNAC